MSGAVCEGSLVLSRWQVVLRASLYMCSAHNSLLYHSCALCMFGLLVLQGTCSSLRPAAGLLRALTRVHLRMVLM